MTTKTELRVTALQLACGLGYPPEQVLKTARSYLAFLDGTETVTTTGQWSLADAMLATYRKPTTKKAPAKKVSPKTKGRDY